MKNVKQRHRMMEFALAHLIENINSDVLDIFIDNRWCQKDFEDLRDGYAFTNKQHVVPTDILNSTTIDVSWTSDVAEDVEEHEPISAWHDNYVQFARLIAEAEGAKIWSDEQSFAEMAHEMDVDPADIREIIGRACLEWELMNKD
jgi:membrane-bound lytic murein transglycosylase B